VKNSLMIVSSPCHAINACTSGGNATGNVTALSRPKPRLHAGTPASKSDQIVFSLWIEHCVQTTKCNALNNAHKDANQSLACYPVASLRRI
jgi:hypothetical protein